MSVDLTSLSRSGHTGVPRPARRWRTRVLLPGAILLTAAGLLAYAARDAFSGAVEVRVAPVIVKEAGAAGNAGPTVSVAPQVIAQAPGWVEPDPYAVNVPALAEGVVREVLVLEGQRVEAGQVVVRLVDDDARLALARAEADVAEQRAMVERARAEASAQSAATEVLRDEVRRKRDLVAAGGVSAGEFARLELRLRGQEGQAEAARAGIALADAGLARAMVMRDEAALTFSRMEIRSPSAGVAMTRLVEPGMRLSMSAPPVGASVVATGGSAGSTEVMGAVLRLYDPEHLQVRVDVPLADAAKIGEGSPAQIVTETLPDRVFTGRVTRQVHEANIQRNTVQFKIAIDDPADALKPEMLTRVRFFPRQAQDGRPPPGGVHPAGAPGTGGGDLDGVRLFILSGALQHASGGSAHVWVVDQRGGTRGPVAGLREVAYAATGESGIVEIASGLRPGDRVVIDPPAALSEGSRLRIVEAAPQETRP